MKVSNEQPSFAKHFYPIVLAIQMLVQLHAFIIAPVVGQTMQSNPLKKVGDLTMRSEVIKFLTVGAPSSVMINPPSSAQYGVVRSPTWMRSCPIS